MKIQESMKVPERDAIVKTSGENLEGMVGPGQLDVRNGNAVAAQFVTKEMFETKIDDVIASGRDHEDWRHTGVDHVSRRAASITFGLLVRRAAAKIVQDVTHVDKIGPGRIFIGEPEVHRAFVRYNGADPLRSHGCGDDGQLRAGRMPEHRDSAGWQSVDLTKNGVALRRPARTGRVRIT